MAGSAGRYHGLETASVVVPDGLGGDREVRYLRRRTPTDPAAVRALATHRVLPEDRMDLVTARYLGDPLAFWRVADANGGLNPDALVGPDVEGRDLVIPIPGV